MIIIETENIIFKIINIITIKDINMEITTTIINNKYK